MVREEGVVLLGRSGPSGEEEEGQQADEEGQGQAGDGKSVARTVGAGPNMVDL